MRSFLHLEVGLPESAAINIAIYGPAAALAALMTVCASLPYCTFIPIIDNGSDMLQLTQFMMLSEVFALISLYALGTAESSETARVEMRSMLRLIIPFVACCASISSYLTTNGLDTNPYSLNSFSMSAQFIAMSPWGIAGCLLFVFIILSQVPNCGISSGNALLQDSEMPDYSGAPRAMMQIWSIFRGFIVISIVVYMLFPADVISAVNDGLGISWRGQSLNYFGFWVAVAGARLVLTPACQFFVSGIEGHLPRPMRGFVVPVLTIFAMILLWVECMLLSQEAASY
ncbi:MAG: hypothetical protein HUJ86_01175 [Synergistes sp.]|nr:hypothetical protein [Synergistes sp.]